MGTEWTVPKKIEVGDGPCFRSPNILRSALYISRSIVIACEAKYEATKKGPQGFRFGC